MQLAVPSPDHYLPMIYALALSGEKDRIELFKEKIKQQKFNMTQPDRSQQFTSKNGGYPHSYGEVGSDVGAVFLHNCFTSTQDGC